MAQPAELDPRQGPGHPLIMSASSSSPQRQDLEEQGWPDLTPEEEAEVRADFARAEEAYRRGECIPADEVLPRLQRAG
jgi:hypothetical protein